MHPNHTSGMTRGRRAAVVASLAIALAACGGSSKAAPAVQPTAASTAAATGASASTEVSGGAAPAASGQVLPVVDNPITNTATEQVLKIDSVLVENNVDPVTGADADDHLEIALSNTGTADLAGFEVFTTYTDATGGVTESYYTKLPADFSIPAGGKRIAHFDNSGSADHFAVNEFSLYKTSVNGLDVTVVVSAANAAPQTMTVQKDAGGAETAD